MSKQLNAGDTFRRKYGFVRPYPGYRRQDIWWSATSNRPATAEGWAYLEIIEVVDTVTFGRLAIVREWWIDPDGNEVEPTQDWIPDKEKADIREHRNVLRSITSKKMEAVVKAPAPAAVEKRKAEIETVEEDDVDRRYAGLDLGNMRTMGTA
jgi:hypothetical protein